VANGGVIVSNVIPTSPAEKAGVQVQDIVLAIDEKPVLTASELINDIKQKALGQRISLKIFRQGAVIQLNARLDPVGLLSSEFDDTSLSATQSTLASTYLASHDPDRAIALLEQAILKGDYTKVRNYAFELLDKSNKGFNPDRLLDFVKRSESQGECFYCDYLMMSYYDLYGTQIGIAESKKLAKQYLETSAKRGFPEALYSMAYVYTHGNLGFTQDLLKGEQYYLKATKAGSVIARNELIEHYLILETFGKDKRLDAQMLIRQESAKLSSVYRLEDVLLYYLGISYTDAPDKEDQLKGVAYLEQLAAFEHDGALWALGLYYEDNDKDRMTVGMPLYVSHFLRAYVASQRKDRLGYLFITLLDEWDRIDNPSPLYEDALRIMGDDFWKDARESYTAYHYGNWLLNKNPLGKDIDKGLKFLKISADHGEALAIDKLHGFYLDPPEGYASVDKLDYWFRKRAIRTPDLAYMLQVSAYGYKKSPNYNPVKGYELLVELKGKNQRLYLTGASVFFGVYQNDMQQFGLNKNDFLVRAATFKDYSEQNKKSVANGLYLFTYHEGIPSEVYEFLIDFYEANGVKNGGEYADEYFKVIYDR